MSDIFGGGVSKSSRQSQQAQLAENQATQRFIEQQTGRARGDVIDIFPAAQETRQGGYQGALDVIGAGIPQQLSAFQQGNIGAQGITAQMLPQIQAAILGNQVQGFTPQAISYDPSFLQGVQAPQVAAPQMQNQVQPVAPRFDYFGGSGFNPNFASGLGQIGAGGVGGGSNVTASQDIRRRLY